MSIRSALNRACKFILLGICLTFFAGLVPIVAKGNPTLLQQNRTPTATRTATPTKTSAPTRPGPFVATPDGPLIFDFPTPRAVGSPGPISGQELSALEKSALAVVKLNGCSRAAATACTASDGSGIIIHPRGLILTALHVVIEEPDDLRSPLLPEVSVGIVEDPDKPVQSAYRATVAAIDSELDLALLRIILPADESEPFFPTLPVENIGNRAFQTGTLRVMGFPQGRTRLKQPAVDFFGFDEDDAVEVEGSLVGRGFSGGPLLVEGEERYHVGGVVFFRTDGPVLVQPMRLLTSLRWRDSEAPRLWIDDVQIDPTAAGGLAGLRLAANVHAVDLAERRLRLVAIAFDPEQDQPWPSADEPLVLRRTFEPARFVDVVPLDLEASLIGLGPLPERLRFALQLWDIDESRLLWDGDAHYLDTAATSVPTATRTPTKTATRTPFSRPSTATPTLTKSTPNAAATVQAAVGATRTAEAIALAVQQSIGATLTALAPAKTPTPTRPRATPTLTPTPPVNTVHEFGGIPFVYVPAGEFDMGSDSDNAGSDEQPVHTVYLDNYWIMQTEVTNAQYAQCVDAGSCRQPNNDLWANSDYSNHPVTHVNWGDAVSYVDWLSGETGRTMRLPTEAEWEKAARGADGRIYPWGNASPDSSLLNYDGNEGGVSPVGSYPDGASPYGVLDMAGNVWEWAADWYGRDYYTSSPERNPQGPESGPSHVLRGGAFNDYHRFVRSPYRSLINSPTTVLSNVGFRVASTD